MKKAMRLLPLMLVAASVGVGLTLAQAQAPAPGSAAGTKLKAPAPKPAPVRVTPPAPGSVPASLVSKSPEPTYDEGTAQRLSAAMLSYSAIEVRGGWPTIAQNAKVVPGASGPEVALLRQRLSISDDLPPEQFGGDAFDAALVAALKRFQARHGLPETGTLGPRTLAALNVPVKQRLRQLAASLDRLAETDFTFAQRYVVVNLPAAFAEAVEGDKVVHRYVVVVGKPDRPSPMVTTALTTVNLNPTWTVPLSIAKKDIITRMRKDPDYIARMHMRVLDGNGGEIDPRTVDWNSDRTPNFTIRQDSGSWNALGAVRIDMPNPHAVYMHDTNHKEFFSADYRFQSSGCARVDKPRDLAAWLLEEQPGWGRREIDAAIAKGTRLDIKLTKKVPVAWIYLTGWATRDGTVHFRDDVYGHDQHPPRPLMADARPVATAARASGFVLQSADSKTLEARPGSYLDSQ